MPKYRPLLYTNILKNSRKVNLYEIPKTLYALRRCNKNIFNLMSNYSFSRFFSN